MRARPSGRNDHPVGDRRLADKIDGNDVVRLGVFETGQNDVRQRI
jgi:hypothetical protein